MNAYKIAIEAIEAVNKAEINGKEFEERIAPLRDVETVVRCKDCKYGYISEFAPPEMRDIWCCARKHTLETVKPDFFCADGERKEGEQG